MRRSIGFWPVFSLLLCMLLVFLWSSGQLNGSIRDLDEKYNQGRVKLTRLQNEQTGLQSTLEMVDTDAFIESQARTLYGYMRPDEIRFVITNPEVLYGTDEVPVR